jgi:hypothetical protein
LPWRRVRAGDEGARPHGALVPAVRSLLPRRPKSSYSSGGSRSITSRCSGGCSASRRYCGRGSAVPTCGWRPLVRGRDVRDGRGPLALRVPGGRPVRPSRRQRPTPHQLRLTSTRPLPNTRSDINVEDGHQHPNASPAPTGSTFAAANRPSRRRPTPDASRSKSGAGPSTSHSVVFKNGRIGGHPSGWDFR